MGGDECLDIDKFNTVAAIAADQIFRRDRLAGGETDCNPLLFLRD
jgi:hypothetical protein